MHTRQLLEESVNEENISDAYDDCAMRHRSRSKTLPIPVPAIITTHTFEHMRLLQPKKMQFPADDPWCDRGGLIWVLISSHYRRTQTQSQDQIDSQNGQAAGISAAVKANPVTAFYYHILWPEFYVTSIRSN